MAIESWRLFDRLQQESVIPAGVKFRISLPTPIAPTYSNIMPNDRPALIPMLTAHMLGEVAAIARALPHDRIAQQWDVCQEVIAWEGYYEPGPVDFRKETIAGLTAIGDNVPADIEVGYHLCYGSPADEHRIQPKDAGIMVEMVSAVSAEVRRPIQFFHLPVPRPRTDDAFCAPLDGLKLHSETELYLGLVHRDDMVGNAARLATARRHVRVDGVSSAACGARADRRTGSAGIRDRRMGLSNKDAHRRGSIHPAQLLVPDSVNLNFQRTHRGSQLPPGLPDVTCGAAKFNLREALPLIIRSAWLRGLLLLALANTGLLLAGCCRYRDIVDSAL
jgi:hypothetical protein